MIEFRQTMLKSLDGTLTKPEALAWFKFLYDHTFDFIKSGIVLNPKVSVGTPWKYTKPLGVCSHFTMTPEAITPLRWYATGNNSISFLIDTNGAIFCLVKFWENEFDLHEPLCNGISIGVEFVNVGQIDKKSCWWLNKFNTAIDTQVTKTNAGLFQSYTYEQIEADVAIKRALAIYYDFQPNRFFEHSKINLFVSDNGPHFKNLTDLYTTRTPITMQSLTDLTGPLEPSTPLSPEYPEVLNFMNDEVGVLNTNLSLEKEDIIEAIYNRLVRLGFPQSNPANVFSMLDEYNHKNKTKLQVFDVQTKFVLERKLRAKHGN